MTRIATLHTPISVDLFADLAKAMDQAAAKHGLTLVMSNDGTDYAISARRRQHDDPPSGTVERR